MKLIKVHQVKEGQSGPLLASELYLNKDIIRWAYQKKIEGKVFTFLTLIADDKPLIILETPEQINKLCNFVQGVKIVRDKSH